MSTNLNEQKAKLRKSNVKSHVSSNVTSNVSSNVNLPFLNVNENFKYSIQDNQKDSIVLDFNHSLQNLKGNGLNSKTAFTFDKVTLYAAAYFFECIFGEDLENGFKQHKTNDWDYTITAIKGYFDACNLTDITPTTTIVSEHKTLVKTPLFEACYLIIQTAFHYGTSFGSHQLLEYLDHYIREGEKLPIENYKYDVSYLDKKYNDIDLDKKGKSKEFYQTTKSYLKHWYYSSQELIIDYLGLRNDNFKKQKEGEYRIYNSLAQCPRTLRTVQPFLLVGFDISAAYPSFIDEIVGSNLGRSIYDNLAAKQGITRSEAKTIFNKALNSKEYRKTMHKKEIYFAMLLDCGYTSGQALKILYAITDNKDFTFFYFGSKIEQEYINRIKKENHIFNVTRLHDAIVMIKDNSINYLKLKTNFGPNVSFSFEEINQPNENQDFKNSNKKLNFNRIQFTPNKFYLSHYCVPGPLPKVKGVFNDVIDVTINEGFSKEQTFKQRMDVTFYEGNYNYISCNFDYFDKKEKNPLVTNYYELLTLFLNGFNTLLYLNYDYNLKLQDVRIIVNRYRALTNLCFDVETMVNDVYSYASKRDFKPEIKKRNYTLNSKFKIIDDFCFMVALSIAKGKISFNYNYFNILERTEGNINNNDFVFIDFDKRSEDKELLKLKDYINFNLTSKVRPSKTPSKELLACTLLEVFCKATASKTSDHSRQAKANETRRIKSYEKNIIKLMKIEHNRNKVKELLLYIDPKANINYNSNEHTKAAMVQDIEAIGIIIKRKHTQALETKVIPMNPTAAEYETDYTKSIFFHKIPSTADIKGSYKWQKGTYNHCFMMFHQRHGNWELIQELIFDCKIRDLRFLRHLRELKSNHLKTAV
jgi:hypothetical protein